MSKNLFVLSCKCIGSLLTRCFLKYASGLSRWCSCECIFPTSDFDVEYTFGFINSSMFLDME